jgi:hypothetical protein
LSQNLDRLLEVLKKMRRASDQNADTPVSAARAPISPSSSPIAFELATWDRAPPNTRVARAIRCR